MDNAGYLARTSDHGYETCVEHLSMVSCFAGSFASRLGYLEEGLIAGLLHDAGKYSDAFQKRIRDPENTSTVDHSTLGAILASNLGYFEAAFAIAGHHAGLPDGGNCGDVSSPTFSSRIRQENQQEEVHKVSPILCKEILFENINSSGCAGSKLSDYSRMMITRMIFSCLVDADRLDAEYFTSSNGLRREFKFLEYVHQELERRWTPQALPITLQEVEAVSKSLTAKMIKDKAGEIDSLVVKMRKINDQLLGRGGKSQLDKLRCDILKQCISKGRNADYGKGVYTLTAPTGSGKTNSSITFALEHAKTNNLERVIYVIPYTSIIDQTAAKLEEYFDDQIDNDNPVVLPHYSEASYQMEEKSDLTQDNLRRRFAAENWNVPIVVTTAVQFFESLYSSKASKCRKLHNLTNSVIIFDEAQTLPIPYLIPCVEAISELVKDFDATAILCTATQPTLLPCFRDTFSDEKLEIPELIDISDDDRKLFDRTTISYKGKMSAENVAEELKGLEQALCIVNTRKSAQEIYDIIKNDSELEGTFCLTTLQCAFDRLDILRCIRKRLSEGKECKVIATSLIEAGVDIDFPVVYREETGIDSVFQAAGRCNREGKRDKAKSPVYIFSLKGQSSNALQQIRQNIDATEVSTDRYQNFSFSAVQKYFNYFFSLKGETALDSKNIMLMHKDGSQGCLLPFRKIDEKFKIIDSDAVTVYIPLDDTAKSLCKRLKSGEFSKGIFRKLGRYSVNVWPKHLEELSSLGKVTSIDDDRKSFILDDLSVYSREYGLQIKPATGEPIFV